VPFEQANFPVWTMMTIKPTPWQNIPQGATAMQAMEHELSPARYWTFLQEIIFRAMCRTLQRAFVTGRSMKCPWADRGCQAAQPSCRNIRKLDEIPKENCALREFLKFRGINLEQVSWQ
jgi:hypothetical protein